MDGLPVEKVAGDVLNIESLQSAFADADIVFHLAARISITGRDTASVEKINVTGVQNVVTACLTNHVKRLVHFSSIHAHEQLPLEQTLDESRKLVTPTHKFLYDRTKAQGESIVAQAIGKGLDAIILNPTGIIGPYDFEPSLFGAVIVMMANGRLPVTIGGGFDWVDVRDVAEGAVRAAFHAPAGGKYLLSGHWVSLKDVAREVGLAVNRKPPAYVLPLRGANLLVPFIEAYCRVSGTRPLFTKAAINAIGGNRNISHENANRTFGYKPRPFYETINDAVTWFKQCGLTSKK